MMRVFRFCLAAVVLLVLIWMVGMAQFARAVSELEIQAPANPPADAIVVLTGGSNRLQEGLTLLRANKAKRLYISGVDETVSLEEVLDKAGIDTAEQSLKRRIEFGQARDTIGNARETAAWLRSTGITSFILVTANYHMPRSLLEFRAATEEKHIILHPVRPNTFHAQRWWTYARSVRLMALEYNKFLASWFRLKTQSAL